MAHLPALAEHETARIRQHALGALLHAGVRGVVPTPLDEVTAALDLKPVEDLFDLGDVPPGLAKRIARFKNKVLGALAVRERTVYVDLGQPRERARFTHAHELGHRVLPGHREVYFGDDASTLRPGVRDLLEAEANQFSAELLFQAGLFAEEAGNSRLGLGVAIELAERFESSMHAAIRHYVESSTRACALAMLGRFLIHPDGIASMKVIYASESEPFLERFGPAAGCIPKSFPVSHGLGEDAYCILRNRGGSAIAEGGIVLSHTRRGSAPMEYEVFSNGYFSFVLLRPRRKVRRRPAVHVVRPA